MSINSRLKYPEPESNRHEIALIGFWDQRVYLFRHPGEVSVGLGVGKCGCGNREGKYRFFSYTKSPWMPFLVLSTQILFCKFAAWNSLRSTSKPVAERRCKLMNFSRVTGITAESRNTPHLHHTHTFTPKLTPISPVRFRLRVQQHLLTRLWISHLPKLIEFFPRQFSRQSSNY